MPRRARIVIPGQAHHITQRGNNRQYILKDDQDFKKYCYLIRKYAQEYSVDILAYCLMNNHVHLIMVPETNESMGKLLRTIHMRFSQYYNFKNKSSGHVWQGRYFSCVVGESHLFNAIRYVEQNPVRANMVKHPWDYQWSSAKWHVGKVASVYIKVKNCSVVDKRDWKVYLMNKDEKVDEQLRKKTYKGIAFASDSFIDCWERKLNCILGEKQPGRKKK